VDTATTTINLEVPHSQVHKIYFIILSAQSVFTRHSFTAEYFSQYYIHSSIVDLFKLTCLTIKCNFIIH
jgi:hypothetical protein